MFAKYLEQRMQEVLIDLTSIQQKEEMKINYTIMLKIGKINNNFNNNHKNIIINLSRKHLARV